MSIFLNFYLIIIQYITKSLSVNTQHVPNQEIPSYIPPTEHLKKVFTVLNELQRRYLTEHMIASRYYQDHTIDAKRRENLEVQLSIIAEKQQSIYLLLLFLSDKANSSPEQHIHEDVANDVRANCEFEFEYNNLLNEDDNPADYFEYGTLRRGDLCFFSNMLGISLKYHFGQLDENGLEVLTTDCIVTVARDGYHDQNIDRGKVRSIKSLKY